MIHSCVKGETKEITNCHFVIYGRFQANVEVLEGKKFLQAVMYKVNHDESHAPSQGFVIEISIIL